MAEPKVYTFLDPQPLARAVIVSIWVYLAASTLMGMSNLIVLDRFVTGSLIEDGSPILWAPAFIYVLTLLVSGFLILKWTYRVSRNAHAFSQGLQVSPPWAVGWYFVPIGFLWKPFQALREAWQASSQPDNWKDAPVPVRMRWWWGLWLGTIFLGQLSARFTAIEGPAPEALVAATVADIAGSLVDVPLCILLVGIVRDLSQLQTAEGARRKPAADAVAPSQANIDGGNPQDG
ncbi:MAG: DUF4328 domain-containing protein [Phenylobacterium sp.]